MNLLSAPLKKNLIIKSDSFPTNELRYYIGKNSIICVLKKLKKTGVIIGYKSNRIAIDTKCAEKIKVEIV